MHCQKREGAKLRKGLQSTSWRIFAFLDLFALVVRVEAVRSRMRDCCM
jgi:hypothetical protein